MLVSDATEVLLRNRVALRPLGEHRLRSLHGRMSVFQVIAAGLPAEFPALERHSMRLEALPAFQAIRQPFIPPA